MKKIALVTGGNSGIGFETAKLLKEKEYEVYISGRNPGRLEQAADELDVNFLVADMGDTGAIKALAANFKESGLDILVNNAGGAVYTGIDDFTLEDFSETFNPNVLGPLLLIKELLPALEKEPGAAITNVGSLAEYKPKVGSCLYTGSKSALSGFTRALAVELGPRGIRVNEVLPGAIETPIFSKIGLSEEQIKELKEVIKNENPLGKFGKPGEVAHVIVAQLESTFVTGALWIVDGGAGVA